MEDQEINQLIKINWIEFLGRGSFGFVFKTKIKQNQTLPESLRAVKVFIGNDIESLEDWKKEFEIIRNLEHENIVTNFEMHFIKITQSEMKKMENLRKNVEQNYTQYFPVRKKEFLCTLIEMELCGKSLKQWLEEISNKDVFITEGIRFNMCQQIKKGVIFLHDKKIIHRDLKPANICLATSKKLIIKICDFGQSRYCKSKEPESMTIKVGTEAYRAPEISFGKYEGTVDIFSLGIIIYEIFQKQFQTNWGRSVAFIKDGKGDDFISENKNITNLKSIILEYTNRKTEIRSKSLYYKSLSYTIPEKDWITDKHFKDYFSLILDYGQLPINFYDVLEKNKVFSKILSKPSLAKYKMRKYWGLNDIENVIEIMTDTIERPKNILTIEQKVLESNLTNFSEIIIVKDPLSLDVGRKFKKIRHADYIQVTAIQSLPMPTKSIPKFRNMLSYILQNIKMSNSLCTQAKFLYDYKARDNAVVKEDSESDDDNYYKQYCFSRLDLIVTLLSVADDLLAIDIIRILGQFSITLPMVMPVITKKSKITHVITIPWLENITIKRETSGQIQEGQLFKRPFKILLVLRQGAKAKTKVGKSALLNSLFNNDFMFSSSLEPKAGKGLPYSLQGCIEIAWLTTENCKEVLFEKIDKELYGISSMDKEDHYIIANLHGEYEQNREIIETIRPIITSFLVFKFSEQYAYIKIFEKEDSLFSKFNFELEKKDKIELNPSDYIVQNKISRTICEALKLAKPINKFDVTKLKCMPSLKIVSGTYTNESQSLIDFIMEKEFTMFKEEMWLQKYAIDDLPVQQYAEDLSNHDFTKKYTELFQKLLILPIDKRQIAIYHLEQQLAIHSGRESKQVRLKLLKLKQNRSKALKDTNPNDREKNKKLKEKLDLQIHKTADELERNNLGLEHLLRELGKIFEISLHSSKCQIFPNMPFKTIIRQLAELVVEGQVIEVVDGDLGEISGVWLNAVLREVSTMLGEFRIFVISILGLQSSGKSTLLNCLFGSKFSVSSGRCTRGLFMRLLFLDSELRNKTQYDGIILVDTEGMCAPEKMMDEKADLRDREMATFAMLISNLTLINIMGETMKEMTDILQIVVVTMARLEKVEVTADVLLVQHCSEVDNSKFQNATTEFCKALRQAIDITDKQFAALGIVNSACLKTLVERVDNHQLLQLFHSYKSGETANASPSIRYHDDCKVFFNSIIEVMSKAPHRWNFDDWYNLIPNYWAALKKQDFSLKFKNIQEIHDFIDRGNRIAIVNLCIEEAMTSHRRAMKNKLREEIIVNQTITKNLKQFLFQEICQSIEETIKDCKWTDFSKRQSKSPFAKDSVIRDCTCYKAVQEISNIKRHVHASPNVEIEVTKTINSYITKIRGSTIEQLKIQLDHKLTQKQKLHEIDIKIPEFVKSLKKPFNKYEESMQEKLSIEFWQKNTNYQNSSTELNIKNKIFPDIIRVYNSTPIESKQSSILSKSSLITLENKKAISGSGYFSFFDGKLKSNQSTRIKNDIYEKLESLIKKSEIYQESDCFFLKKITEEIIAKYSDLWGKFRDDFKWEVHLYAVRLFLEIYEKQIIKNSLNSGVDSLNSLLKKKNFLRMKYGFQYKGEGIVLAEFILHAALQKGKKEAENFAKDELSQQAWLSSINNVRLSFFENLAEKINSDDYDSAISYFQNPSKTIIEWFSSKVDTNTNEIILLKKAAQESNKQIIDLVEELGNIYNETKGDIKKVRNACLKYLSEVDGIHYVSNFSVNNHNLKEAEEFMDSLSQTINEKAQKKFLDISFKKLSDSKSVKDKLGCTEFCYWCGALCWGHAGHDLNEDVTKKHHTCHQPQGLFGIVNENNQRLIAETCENMDDDYLKLIKPGSPGKTWRQIKLSKKFEDWIFINHSFDDFNNLMSWFFVKLNDKIATINNVKPSTEKELKRLGYSELESKLASMLISIKQKLQ